MLPLGKLTSTAILHCYRLLRLIYYNTGGIEMKKRTPAHIGIIPDGNRRWAIENGYDKKDGYSSGILPGFKLYEIMLHEGISEATFYGFTKDNNKRPKEQRDEFTKSCIDAVNLLSHRDANLHVIGNTDSPAFPDELKEYANQRVCFGQGKININFLVNYDWKWDLESALKRGTIASHIIPRVDMIIRWGGRRRLSGFLPVQSVYADFYVIEQYWPDFEERHFYDALDWYQNCDITLGG